MTPDEIARTHPLFNPIALHLDTLVMKNTLSDVTRWLWNGSTGALLTGESRAGKTRLIRAISQALETRDKRHIPAHYFSTPRRDVKNITGLFRELCFSAGLLVQSREQASHLANRFLHYMLDSAIEHQCNTYVLFVDEMHRLSLPQFDAFAELHDNLQEYGIQLVVIFIGNDPEYIKLINSMKNNNMEHILGRFFFESAILKGITSRKEVAYCLKQYDELRYPEDGESYTGYMLPEDVAKGWKLESISADLWECFYDFKHEHGLTSWKMKYFTKTVNTLLVDYLPRFGVENIDYEMIKKCIELSGLKASLVEQVKCA